MQRSKQIRCYLPEHAPSTFSLLGRPNAASTIKQNSTLQHQCICCLQAIKVLWLGVLSSSAVLVKPADWATCPRFRAMYSSSQGSVLLKAVYAIGLPKTALKDADKGFISYIIQQPVPRTPHIASLTGLNTWWGLEQRTAMTAVTTHAKGCTVIAVAFMSSV